MRVAKVESAFLTFFICFPCLHSVHPILSSSAGNGVFSKYIRDLGCCFPHLIQLGRGWMDDFTSGWPSTGCVYFQPHPVLAVPIFSLALGLFSAASYFFFGWPVLAVPILALGLAVGSLQPNVLATICSINILDALETVSSTQPWQELDGCAIVHLDDTCTHSRN